MKQLTSIIVEKKDTKLDVELSNDFNILEDKSNFSNLKYLTLSNSNLKEIPNWIYKCISLRYLDLSNNKLKELPTELFNLPLVYLDINENKISKIDTQNKDVYIQTNHSEFNKENYNTDYDLNKKSDYCIMIHDDNGHNYDRSEFEYAIVLFLAFYVIDTKVL